MGCVEVSLDVTFDEFDGSQKEPVISSIVGIGGPSNQPIKKLAICEVKPRKVKNKYKDDMFK